MYDKAFFVAILLVFFASVASVKVDRAYSMYLFFSSLNLINLWINSNIILYLVCLGVGTLVMSCYKTLKVNKERIFR